MRVCVSDYCKGINPREQRKIRKIIRINKPKPPSRGPTRNCQMFADPHVVGFAGLGFNAQTPGDWTLYKGKDLEISYRAVSHGSWAGISQFGIIIFGQKITSIGF